MQTKCQLIKKMKSMPSDINLPRTGTSNSSRHSSTESNNVSSILLLFEYFFPHLTKKCTLKQLNQQNKPGK
jgi:hypothetical protein